MTAVDPRGRERPFEPPYLLTTVTERDGVGLTVVGDASGAVAEMAAHGQWSQRLCEEVTAGLSLCVAGPTTSIVIDLGRLEDPHGASMPFWLAQWRQARLARSPVQLAFCLPATAALGRRLRTLRGPQPRVFASVPEARKAIAERMSGADRLQARLRARPISIRAARDLVTHACHAWELPHLTYDTKLIASELATNAVEHAGTDFLVTASRAGSRVHVAVHDGTRRFPHPDEPMPEGMPAAITERGRGLMLVHKIAVAWGVTPARTGKVVWATVE